MVRDAPGHAVPVVVFYDENGNGRLDSSERVRVPGAVVEVAGRSGRTDARGRALLERVPAGTQQATLRADTLPPFFVAGAPLALRVPLAGELPLRVTLPIGDNRPNVYMALGDSLTDGAGSSDDNGYRVRLEAALRAHFGAASVINEGVPGTDSHHGAHHGALALLRHRPAATLILLGANDWSEDPGRSRPTAATINSLRRLVRGVKAARSLPFLATLPPVNAGFDATVPPPRNDWVTRTNDRIRALARAEGAVLVDLHQAFLRQPPARRLFSDALHPNDAGYALIAEAFFSAITTRGPR